ncbi:hypothetical protein R1sor_021997 [Riccia sorocarpa]|uniref:Uncharacterized protein n=1 Tax=Riccia sorocarpa TaxID=122646 RepID=A0ABD3GK45_9MARC
MQSQPDADAFTLNAPGHSILLSLEFFEVLFGGSIEFALFCELVYSLMAFRHLKKSYISPRQDVLPYFETLGYFKPNQVSFSEFLEEVADPEGVQYLQVGFPRVDLEGFEGFHTKVLIVTEIFAKWSTARSTGCRVSIRWERISSNQTRGCKPIGRVTSIDEKLGSGTITMNRTDTIYVQTVDELVAAGELKGQLNYVKIQPSKLDNVFKEPQTRLGCSSSERMETGRSTKSIPSFIGCTCRIGGPEFCRLFKGEMSVTWRNKLGLITRAVQFFLPTSSSTDTSLALPEDEYNGLTSQAC